MNIFEITVQRKTDDRWPVVVEQTRAGALPLVKQGWLELDQARLLPQVMARDYGRMLGQALFVGDVRDAFVQALSATDDRLHVLLHIEADDLKTLRWERLCAPVDGQWEFLLLNQRTPFSLYLPSVTDRRFPPFGRLDLRALVVAASPTGLEQYRLAPFDVAGAVRRVHDALGDIPSDSLAAADVLADAVGPPSLAALAARITAQPYTLLHLVCHGTYAPGTGETLLFLAGSDNQVEVVTASRLIERLRAIQGVRGLPHLAFLATCDSAAPEAEAALGGLGQRLVRELGMPAVVAMTERVSVQTADALAGGFYSRLREHGQPDLALAEASAGLAERHDITVPALFSRLAGRPLWSDALDREPTAAEIHRGLDQLARLLPERAPVLVAEFAAQAQRLRDTVSADSAVLSTSANKERLEAQAGVNALSEEVLDLSFNGLCFGRKPPSYDARCPFPGLIAFDADDSNFFFGREPLVEQLTAKLAGHNFLPVLGPSGCGKSSLVLAGLAPALKGSQPRLQVAILRPGSEPVAQMDRALAGLAQTPNEDTLLIVDQFEELFTLTQDAGQRQTFVERLLAESRSRRVVLTMRGDFLDDCAAYDKLYAALQSRLQLIAPMSPAELRSAMEQQAGAVGLRFEADLANTILDDAAGEPGAMPLLQHALLELWKRRHGRWLRASEYRTMGGVQGAVARTAEAVYTSLPDDEQSLVRNICVRLVRLDEKDPNRDTRRRAGFDELVTSEVDRPVVVRLVNRLANEKLLVSSVNPVNGQQEIELAHEALIEEWGRLRGWIDADRTGLLVQRHLTEAAQEWTRLKHDPGVLYRGAPLAEAIEWSEAHPGDPNGEERAFLRTSQAAQIQGTRLRYGAVLAIAALLITVLAVVAASQSQLARERGNAQETATALLGEAEQARGTAVAEANSRATEVVIKQDAQATAVANERLAVAAQQTAVAEASARATEVVVRKAAQDAAEFNELLAGAAQRTAVAEADNAKRAALRSRSGELAAQAIASIERDPELGILLALEAISTTQTASAEDTLRRALLASYVAANLPHDQLVMGVAFSPDGKRLVTGAWRTPIQMWDGDAYGPLGPLNGVYSPTVRLDYDPAGNQIASAHSDGTVRLWDARTGVISHTLSEGHSQRVWDVDFSPDGRRLASGSKDGTVVVWDAISGQSVQTLRVTSEVNGVAFNRDGKFLATASSDGVARVWDLTTESVVFSRTHFSEAGADALYGAAFSPTDNLLAVSGSDRTVTLWQPDNAQESPEARLRGHTDVVTSVDFSSDGKRLVSADGAGIAIVWDVSDLTNISVLKRLKGHTDQINAALFDSDGVRVATAGYDQTVKLWTVAAHHGWIYDLAFDPVNRDRLVTASADGTARVWSFHEGRLALLNTLRHGSEVRLAVFSPDGRQIATAGKDNIVKLWNAGTGELLRTLEGHSDLVRSVAFSHDGTRIATASYDGQAGLWDAQSGQIIRFLKDGGAKMNDVAISVDDRFLATASDDNTARLWRVDTGELVNIFSGHDDSVERVAFSPDGSTLATVSSDSTTRLWDPVSATTIYTFIEHTDRIIGLAYDPTGRRLATAGMDGRIVIHDLATGKPQQELFAEGEIYGVAFSPDGRYILFVGRNGDIGVEALAVEDLVAQARSRLTRGWRPEECKKYLGMEDCPPAAMEQR